MEDGEQGSRSLGRAGTGRNQGQFPRHMTCELTRDPELRRVLRWVQCSAVIVLKSFPILSKVPHIFILHWSHQLCSQSWGRISRFSRKQSWGKSVGGNLLLGDAISGDRVGIKENRAGWGEEWTEVFDNVPEPVNPALVCT